MLDGSGSIPYINGMMSASAPHGTQEHALASRIQNNSSAGQPLYSPAAVEGWFHELNNHVTSQCQGLEDDEPFHPEGVEHGYSGEKQCSSDPLHDPILSQMRNNNNNELENVELRGIVDDLTLEIKRLKNKLRRYKERDPPRLQRDKLFEVRTYGLSRRKKRQLERILERFAAEISSGPRPTRNKTSLKKKPLTGNYDALPLGQESWKILIASLFKQCFNQAMGPATRLESLKPSQSSNSWQDVNELLESLKNRLAVIDIDFSLQAIKDYGAPLELSPDGRSVRWSENSVQESIQTQGSSIEPGEQNVSRRQANDTTKKNTMHKDIVLGFVPNDHIQLPTNHTDSADFLPYTLKACGNDTDDDFLSMVSSDSEIISQQTIISQAHRQVFGAPPPTQTKSQDRLTYYRNATFYTDCAGDKPTATELIAAQATGGKDTGEKRKRQSSANSSRCQQKRHDIISAAHRFQDYPTEKDSALNLSQCSSPALSLAQEPLTSAMDESKALPLELEASGVGDVAPDDNFAVHVVMKHVPVSPEDDSDGGSKRSQFEGQATDKLCNQSDQSRLLSRPFFKDIMTSESSRNEKLKDKNKKLYRTHLVTATHESLAPSSLPPATCGVFSSSSSDEDAYGENYGSDCGEDYPYVQDEKARKRHDISWRNKARTLGVTGHSTTSAHAIEQWNAQVLASLKKGDSAWASITG